MYAKNSIWKDSWKLVSAIYKRKIFLVIFKIMRWRGGTGMLTVNLADNTLEKSEEEWNACLITDCTFSVATLSSASVLFCAPWETASPSCLPVDQWLLRLFPWCFRWQFLEIPEDWFSVISTNKFPWSLVCPPVKASFSAKFWAQTWRRFPQWPIVFQDSIYYFSSLQILSLLVSPCSNPLL